MLSIRVPSSEGTLPSEPGLDVGEGNGRIAR